MLYEISLTFVAPALIELQGELRRLAPGQKVNEAQVQEILALLKKTGSGSAPIEVI